jgi:serine/threonine protein kinase
MTGEQALAVLEFFEKQRVKRADFPTILVQSAVGLDSQTYTGIQTLPLCYTWAELGTVTSTPMEFVEGETLEKLIKRSGRLDIKLALEITTQVAAGLGAVHEQYLVHRDIKPTNIMVRLKEERSVSAKIIDLGLAKTLDESG